MSTPEGRVKAQVKKVLNGFGTLVHHHWPVQNGMGAPTLDCNAVVCGRAFSIETKAPGEKPTARQEQTIAALQAAGSRVWVIDGAAAQLSALRMWLEYWAARGMVEEGIPENTPKFLLHDHVEPHV